MKSGNSPDFRDETAICFSYGRQMAMRTMNISLGGLKLGGIFDLRVDESMILDILKMARGDHAGEGSLAYIAYLLIRTYFFR